MGVLKKVQVPIRDRQHGWASEERKPRLLGQMWGVFYFLRKGVGRSTAQARRKFRNLAGTSMYGHYSSLVSISSASEKP